jgi:hypothetical protein
MKYIALLFAATLAMGACSSPGSKTSSGDTAMKNAMVNSKSTSDTSYATAISSLCFVRLEGNQQQDSTTVELSIKGNTVTGEMHWIPFEKDGRKGILNGRKNGDIINAVWTFKQEGMTDTMAVEFQLKNNQLSQKPLKQNLKDGRQQTDEAAGYSVEYQPYGGRRPDKIK